MREQFRIVGRSVGDQTVTVRMESPVRRSGMLGAGWGTFPAFTRQGLWTVAGIRCEMGSLALAVSDTHSPVDLHSANQTLVLPEALNQTGPSDTQGPEVLGIELSPTQARRRRRRKGGREEEEEEEEEERKRRGGEEEEEKKKRKKG